MFRLGLLATLSVTILTGCVSSYGYRADQGGDYYYAEPSVDYYDNYGGPYSSIGYGHPGGWYGNFGYGFGFGHTPYSRYGFPYGYDSGRYGYPYSYYPYRHRRPPHHRPPDPPPGTLPPGVIIDNDPPPGNGPHLGDRDGGPWRHLGDRRPPTATPQPAILGISPRPGVFTQDMQPGRRRIMIPQPGVSIGDEQPGSVMQVRRAPVSSPQAERPPSPRDETPRDAPAPERRIERQERETRREQTP